MSWKKLNETAKELESSSEMIATIEADARALYPNEFIEKYRDSSTFKKAIEWLVRLLYIANGIPVFGKTTKAIIALLIAFCEGVLLQGRMYK